jgi:hypothetical protein
VFWIAQLMDTHLETISRKKGGLSTNLSYKKKTPVFEKNTCQTSCAGAVLLTIYMLQRLN